MKVSDQMTRTPLTCRPGATVGQVAKMMTGQNRMHLIVVDESGATLGMITASDLIAKHARLHFPTYFSLLGFSFPVEPRHDDREIKHALAATAGELMSTHLLTVTPNSDVDDAATLMLDNELGCLPVIDDGRLVGTIDEADIVRLLVVEESE